mgnify:CR=1 FL=1
MDLIKYNKNMGKLVKLVFAIVYNIRYLFLFIVFNVSMFALYYLALGFRPVSQGELETYHYWHYFIESWKIATKGSATQLTSIWEGTEFERL